MKNIFCEGHQERELLNLILSFLENNIIDRRVFDAVLAVFYEKWEKITLKIGELLNADRATIFLFDEEPNELWAIVAKDENGKSLEIRIPATVGILGEVATFKKVVNIPYDFYDDPRSVNAKKSCERIAYPTYSLLAMPLLNEETGELIVVVQLINKLKPNHQDYGTLDEQIDKVGFTQADEQIVREFAPSIRRILECSQSFYAATQRQRAATALMHAVSALSQSSLDLDDTVKLVMDQAQELMQVDRSTLWVLDEDKDELWTKISICSYLKELRIPRTAGLPGIVAQSGEPLLIPFDVYDHPRAAMCKATDIKTAYRTCSILCMPVFNADHKLIGVTQLINKKRPGEFPPYNPDDWPQAPEQWKASFSQTDLEFMKVFNIQAGVALQNAILFSEVKQQETRHKDIVRSLPNGVISTDKKGKIITANERAKQLLGAREGEVVEGVSLGDLIKIENDSFSQWLNSALSPQSDRDREQYYPDRVLLPLQGEPQKIDLWVNSMTDAIDPNKINGVLVILENKSRENPG
ncbi:GAF domain-containing protein [Microcoleus sp.]|uniref:GAF domain-containing protein n=1 Tax=Microcoleus sp. TaxID=44472 RepID=UPI00403E4228